MKKNLDRAPLGSGRNDGEGEWKNGQGRRKRGWSGQDRKCRKERSRPGASELDEALAQLVTSGFLS